MILPLAPSFITPPSPRLHPGAHTMMSRSWAGASVTAPPSTKWRHPWWTSLYWVGPAEKWVATIKPGFVNGSVPIYPMTLQQERPEQITYGINPLTGKPFFSDPVFEQQARAAGETITFNVPLYYRPAIDLPFRAIGFDGGPNEAVPEFFADKGVGKAPPDLVDQLLDGKVNQDSLAPAKGNRLLRACDLVLHQPHMALSAETTVDTSAVATGKAEVTQTLTVRSAAPGDTLRVFAGPKFDPTAALSGGIDPLSGDYEEPNFDEILISTVYLLSPPDTAPGSTPNVQWIPYVRHNLFWNLNWAQPPFVIRPAAGNIDTGAEFLAGGAAATIINLFQSQANQALQDAQNVVNAYSLAGSFWTCTGGGSDSVFPVVPAQPAAGASGLDKDGRLQAQRVAAAAAKRAGSLDPDFPYRSSEFPLSLIS